MKINLTLDIPDDLRRAIGKLVGAEITQEGLATRDTVLAFLNQRLSSMAIATEGFEFAQHLIDTELSGYEDAIAYLKAGGWDSTQIKRWVFKQRARRDFLDAKLS
jgi:hypothetical protein